MDNQLYQIVVFVPESHLEKLKAGLFDAGAGALGNYDRCSWQTPGTGQFRALVNAQPHIGETLKLCAVAEYRLEVACSKHKLQGALKALLAIHPYETPAYHVIPHLTFET